MITNRSVLLAALLATTAFLSLGCAQEEKLQEMRGTVTFDGKPIPLGIIFFDPDSSKGTTGRQGSANIKNGQFTTQTEGVGIKPGSYVIRVAGFDGKVGNEAPMGQALFNEYTTTQEIPAGMSELKIDVPKKK